MSKNICRIIPACQDDTLRHYAVLHDGLRRDQNYQRAWNATGGHFRPLNLPWPLTPEQELYYPAVAQVQALGGVIRYESRCAKAFIREFDEQHAIHKDLVLLTVRLHELDDLPLYWSHGREVLVAGSKAVLIPLLSVYGKGVRWMIVVIERDYCMRTHAHCVTTKRGLCARYRAALESSRADALARRVKDQGVLLEDTLHGVIMGDTPGDRRAVAHYLRKHPDGRCTLPRGHDLRLEMENEIAERMIWGEGDPQRDVVWRILQDWKPGRRLS